ncbi:MAG: FAD-binding oxidoreductase [Anaerolineae bacterium]|nr:FAD-binding oxidoreductase [Anaerolineae bacterium]
MRAVDQTRFLSNPAPDDLPKTADVVILGGGPAGTAAAWALERAAPGLRIVVIEQGVQLGMGASLASLENFRTCWAAPCLAKMMQRSLEVFHQADDEFYPGAAAALSLKQQGYLFLGFTERQSAALRKDVDHLHACGLTHTEFLDAAEVHQRYPWLGERVTAAKYDPHAGWLDSNALIYAFANSTRSTRFLLEMRDVRIRVAGGKITGVHTASGDIAAPVVLIAAGAGTRALGRAIGIEIPVVVRPRQSFTTPWRHAAFPPDSPCVISAAPFPHVRSEARDGAIFGWEYRWNSRPALPDDPVQEELTDPLWPVEQFKDARFPSVTLALLARQFDHRPGEGFADPRYLRGIAHRAGYYVYRDSSAAYLTDSDGTRRPYHSQRAILDAWPGMDGLFLSVAHVGHGIMSAPAAGEIIAARILGRPLPDPAYADFGLHVPAVEHDAGGLSLPL